MKAETITLLRKGQGSRTFEEVSDSDDTSKLKDQLDALDTTLWREHPLMVLTQPNGTFKIYSAVRTLRQ